MILSSIDTLGLAASMEQNLLESQKINKKNFTHDIIHKIRNWFSNIEFTGEKDQKITKIPIAELHRPKIPGCKATLNETYSSSEDYSLSVKIFGIDGGTNMIQMFGFDDGIETSEECIRLDVSVTLEGKKYLKKDQNNTHYFWRYDVKKIEKDWVPSIINNRYDKCNLSLNNLQSLRWSYSEFPVPSGVVWTRSFESQRSQSFEIDSGFEILNMEIGPKAVVETLKNIKYSYSLVGPKKYLAYYPFNNSTYRWTVLNQS